MSRTHRFGRSQAKCWKPARHSWRMSSSRSSRSTTFRSQAHDHFWGECCPEKQVRADSQAREQRAHKESILRNLYANQPGTPTATIECIEATQTSTVTTQNDTSSNTF